MKDDKPEEVLLPEYWKIKLGAILHDIGKFEQRAKTKMKHEKLSQIFAERDMPDQLARSLAGIVYSKEFKTESGHGDTVWVEAAKSNASRIIRVADMLSAGERELYHEKNPEREVDKEPLISIFSEVVLSEKPEQSWYHRPEPVTFTQQNFAEDSKPAYDEIKSIYNKEHWNDFQLRIRNINAQYDNDRDIEQYFTKLLYLLRKYTSFVPSSAYYDKPDVSLFEHAKVTCAIASCLYHSKRDIEQLENALIQKFNKVVKDDAYKASENQDQILQLMKEKLGAESLTLLTANTFLLVEGDISGIQKFIYTITSKSAAKTLKGRSFFVSAFTDIIAEHIVRSLDLPITNILFSGGGHFYILAPVEKEAELAIIRKKLAALIYDTFNVDLYLVLEWIPLCANDFDRNIFSEKWSEVSGKVSEQKGKKYYDLMQEVKFAEIFGPFEKGGVEENQCSACKKEEENLETLGEKEPEENQTKLCKHCYAFSKLARVLTDIKSSKAVYKQLNNLWPELFGKLNYTEQDFFINSTQNVPFKFIPGVPLTDKDFDRLGHDAKGPSKLAVLKMDVDNLGKIFSRGLKGKKTISRLSQLSFMFSFFFDGYVNQLLQNDNYKDRIYLVYAGGDDTFLIGAWDAVFELSYDIYESFRNFTCHNPDITISAGLVVVDPRYPVHRSAKMAEEALEKAKSAENKNSICLFGEVFAWNPFNRPEDIAKLQAELKAMNLNEFALLWYLKSLLVHGLGSGLIQKSFLQKVNRSTRGFSTILKDSQMRKIDYVRLSRLGYYLRKELNAKGNDEIKRFAGSVVSVYESTVKQNVFSDKKENLKQIMFIPAAVRWAELLTRSKEGENEICWRTNATEA